MDSGNPFNEHNVFLVLFSHINPNRLDHNYYAGSEYYNNGPKHKC